MTDEVWNVLTVTRVSKEGGGVVSLLKNLTYEQARTVMRQIGPLNDPWSDTAVRQRACVSAGTLPRVRDPYQNVYVGFGQHLLPPRFVTRNVWEEYRQNEFGRVECWGPEGCEMVVWPKPDDYETRLKKALAEEWAKREELDQAEQIVAATNGALKEKAHAHR